MPAAHVECPACGARVLVDAAWAGGDARCGACARPFRVPHELPTGPELLPPAAWRRARAGLGMMYFGGLTLLCLVLLAAGLLVGFSLLAPPELWEQIAIAEDTPDEAIPLVLGSCGLFAVGLVVFLIIGIGCLLGLAAPVPPARSWLARSMATLLVGTAALGGVFVVAVLSVFELENQGDIPDGLTSLLGILILLNGVLGLLTALSHAGFLRRLAVYLENEPTARSAAGYQIFLLLGCPLLLLGLCVLSGAALNDGPTAMALRVATLLGLALLLGWWLALVQGVRRSVQLGLQPIR